MKSICKKDEIYYLDIWIDNNDDFREYFLEINGKRTDYSFKLQTHGMQCVPLTNANQTIITVQLREGKNSFSIKVNGWHYMIQLIKLYQNPQNAGITEDDLISAGLKYPETPIRELLTFSEFELNQITTLAALIPDRIKNDFEARYLDWRDSWDRLLYNPPADIGIPSSWPRYYAQSDEYKCLLSYCEHYGKAIWPLIFEIVNQRLFFLINLMEDLTLSEYEDLYYEREGNIWSKYGYDINSVMIVYAKILLEIEYDNILKAIQDISEMENED